ncbi:MAG: hypothetical protein ACRCSP_02330 [Rhodoglobus sp.]
MDYSVSASGVRLVADKTVLAVEPAVSAFDGLAEALVVALAGTGSGLIPGVVDAFLAERVVPARSVGDRVFASIYGVSAAVAAFEAGDQVMADAVVVAARQSALSGDFSFFGVS